MELRIDLEAPAEVREQDSLRRQCHRWRNVTVLMIKMKRDEAQSRYERVELASSSTTSCMKD